MERVTSTGFNCSLSLPIFPVAAFIVEKLAQQKYISEPVSWILIRWRKHLIQGLLKTFNMRVVEDFMVCYYSRTCLFGEVNIFPLRQLYSSQFSLWKLRIWYACLGVPFEFIHFTLIITALACCALSLSIQALSNLLFSHILHVTS